MISRCYNKNSKSYKDYGGRGIKVQDNWRTDYEAYENYILSLPSCNADLVAINKLSVDRIDNDKGYVEGNLRWADNSTQTFNRRKMKNNTSGYTGIYLQKSGTYRAGISINGTMKFLGCFKTLEEALSSREEALCHVY